jgi:hypothetical protein
MLHRMPSWHERPRNIPHPHAVCSQRQKKRRMPIEKVLELSLMNPYVFILDSGLTAFNNSNKRLLH